MVNHVRRQVSILVVIDTKANPKGIHTLVVVVPTHSRGHVVFCTREHPAKGYKSTKIFTEWNTRSSPMSQCLQKLLSVYQSLGITKPQLIHTIKCMEDDLGMPAERVCEYLVESIENHLALCARQCAKCGMELKSYQAALVRHMIFNRGAIAAFQVGVGKTLTAVMTISCCLRMAEMAGYKKIPVNIVTPLSLKDNMVKEMKIVGVNPDDPRFTFYTFQGYVNAVKRKTARLDNAILIVDEAHELRKLYTARKTYTMDTTKPNGYYFIQSAKRAYKVLLLTGTPVYAHSQDIINLVAMVKGENPMSLKKFEALAADKARIKQEFGGLFMFQDSDPKYYPSYTEKTVRIEMTPKYYNEYMAMESEIMEKTTAGKNKDIFYTRLRQASNTIEPNLKMNAVKAILAHEEPTIFYSQFIDAGAKMIIKVAKSMKIPYRIITGSTPKEDRQKAVNDYNKGKVKLLILTKAGGQGMDTRGTRHVIILESSWTRAQEVQTIGRAVRYKSHEHLPASERHVDVHHIVIVKPSLETLKKWKNQGKIKLISERISADAYLKRFSHQVYDSEIVHFTKLLRSVQIPHS